MNLKEIFSGPRLKKSIGKRVDWLGWVIIVSAIFFAAFFIFNVLAAYNNEIVLNALQNETISKQILYRSNVVSGNSTPEKTYEAARQALLNNDLEGILKTIHPLALGRYEDGLRKAAAQGKLREAAERLTPLEEKIYEHEDSVRYAIKPIPGNKTINPLEGYSESVEFMRDDKGIWKISSI